MLSYCRTDPFREWSLFKKKFSKERDQDKKHLHSQCIVISYLYTIPWQKSLSQKSGLKMLVTKIVIICQPIRQILSIRVQWIHTFHFPFQRRTCLFYTMRDRLSGYIWCLWNQSTGSPTWSRDFCQGTIVRYHYTLTWEDE